MGLLGAEQKVQAVVLAAGVGTRLLPLTTVIPKSLLPIANKPLIDYALDSIQRAGIRDILVVTGYMGSQTAKHIKTFKKNFSAKITCINAERYREGPLYSLLAAEKSVTDDFLLVPADLILDDWILSHLVASHTEKDLIHVATSASYPQTQRTLVLCYKGSTQNNSKILRFLPAGTPYEGLQDKSEIQAVVSMGVAVCPTKLFEYLHLASEKGAQRVVDALSEYAAKTGLGRCLRISSQHYWFDIDTINDMLEANSYILRKRYVDSGKQSNFFFDREKPLSIRVRTNSLRGRPTKIMGPTVIGERCKIGESSIIGPYVSIQNRCVIGKHARISNTIILNESFVDDSAIIDRAVVCGKETFRAEKPGRDV
jgi:NDP-sugar pyrophosphorylase family protein